MGCSFVVVLVCWFSVVCIDSYCGFLLCWFIYNWCLLVCLSVFDLIVVG